MDDTQSAPIKLAELLRHPEDLDKIPNLEAEFRRKKAAIDGQLRLGLREQLEFTQNGLSSISGGQRTINAIKEEMMKIDRLCSEAQTLIRDFPHINLVSQTHKNFAQVEAMKENIESFPARLEELEQLLREDDLDMENQPNLLAVHYGLTQLRDIRDEAMEQIKKADDSSLEGMLHDYFNRLDEVIDWFDDHVGTACMQLIQLVQSGNNGLVVRLALVVEEEERNDKRVQAVMDAQKEYKGLASRLKSIASGPREKRGYKEKFLKAIEMYCQGQFDATSESFLEDPDTKRLEKSLRWFFNDLNTVKMGMVPLMPKKWRIFRTYVSMYHRLMHDWLISLINSDKTTPPQMLAIVNWEPKYYEKMKKLGAPEDALQPHLIDSRGAELVLEYRQLIVNSVDTWLERLYINERQAFLTRLENSLETTPRLHTKTLGDLWRMLNEQIEAASSSSRQDVVEGVVSAIFRALRSRQSAWQNLVATEWAKHMSTQPTEVAESVQSLQDWLIALANDAIACIDEDGPAYLFSFRNAYSALVSPAYLGDVSTPSLEQLQNSYVDLATFFISTFVNMIFTIDFRTVLAEFFTPAWYSKQCMRQITTTFEDYIADYAELLHPSLKDILIEELADTLLVSYLQAIRNKGVQKLSPTKNTAVFEQRVRDDIIAVFAFFESFPDAFPAIKEKWGVVKNFVSLLTSDKSAVVSEFEAFKQEHWDLNVSWIESVVRVREDCDRGLVAGLKGKAAEVGGLGDQRGRVETVMGKVR